MNNNFSQNLKYYRIKAGLKQNEMAEKLGISCSTYSRYESNIREPDIITIIAISDILKVNIDILVGKENTNENSLEYKYNQLDNYGKDVVNTVIDLELKRVKNTSP